MLNWLKDKANVARATLAAEVSNYRNREFMEAVVAACALIANADGNVTSAEKKKMIGYVGSADELKHFKTDQVIGFFQSILGKFEFDASIGKAEALKVIGRIKGKEEQARMVVRVACVIGASDDDFDQAERQVVREICIDLGLNPAEFDL
ncbi:tellurite resistance TerB family protein [Paracoccus sp. ME4]|uniref:tellurite resistance TerB family protein n=1 Tax=Paracoccus sp. ME4 TaxID=3138066 RepID=UPI00398B441E